MTDAERKRTALVLRNIASRAELLATDLEEGRLWEGEFEHAVNEIKARANELPRYK